MKNKLKIIYMGTPEIAVFPLEKIAADNDFQVTAVITQPDKPVGRKKIITSPPVKISALKRNISIFQPEKVSIISDDIKNLSPDIIIVMAYSQLIPSDILDSAKYGAINIHTSLLPKYRGASPIQAAIINGDNETGVTFMLMDKGLDTGPILKQFQEKILPEDTTLSLSKRLSFLASDNISSVIKEFIDGGLTPERQDSGQATFVKEFKKIDGMVDWSLPGEQLERFVRGMFPWPIAFTKIDNEIIKIYSAKLDRETQKTLPIGTVTLINKKPAIKTGHGYLVMEKVQPAGGKIMDAKDFILGRPEIIGKIAE